MNNLIFLRHQFYQLKIEYGVEAALYRVVVGTTDLQTGHKSLTRVKYTIDRAIFIPIKFETISVYSASFLKAAREFAYGGAQDQEMKRVILDARDLPEGFEVLPEDYFVQNHKRYEIKYIERLEIESGYQIVVQRLTGAPVNEVHEAQVYQSIRFLQSAGGEL